MGGALPVLRMVGRVPARLRVAPHSQSSWLGVSWWEFSHPRGAKRGGGGGRGCSSEVLLEGGPGEPRLKQNHKLVVVKLKGVRGRGQDFLFSPQICVVQEGPYLFPSW